MPPNDEILETAKQLRRAGRLQEAVEHYRRALKQGQRSVGTCNNLGNLLTELGQIDDALTSYRQALELDPDNATVHLNKGMAHLLKGDFAAGWRESEWRRKTSPEVFGRRFARPRWDGGGLENKTILLHSEQGHGDTFQFVRYAPLVKARGATVILGCDKAQQRILASCDGIDRLLAPGDAIPAFDVHAPLLSLPGNFGTTLETIPAATPYLHADKDLLAAWRRRITAAGGRKIGLAWRGGPRHPRDAARSIPLEKFAPLLEIAGTAFFSLQLGAGREELEAFPGRAGICDLAPHIGDFADTAAALTQLDLVISCDTALCHLAGALDKPVWVALPFAPDWRWMLSREDSPWYPSMRLFRQSRPSDWDAVFQRIATALEQET